MASDRYLRLGFVARAGGVVSVPRDNETVVKGGQAIHAAHMVGLVRETAGTCPELTTWDQLTKDQQEQYLVAAGRALYALKLHGGHMELAATTLACMYGDQPDREDRLAIYRRVVFSLLEGLDNE